jgi:hypothetical protein
MMACNLTSNVTPAVIPTNTPASPSTEPPTATVVPASATPAPTDTPEPTATDTAVPSDTPAPTATDTPVPTAADTPVVVPIPPSNNYIDDRSTPSQVIVSMYNAINRQEYVRAYDYWDNPSNSVGSFNAFQTGYQDTAAVDLVFGQITGEPGMSQVYYTVPVLLKTVSKGGVHSNFAACYVVHDTNPDVYGAPPFGPMGIYQGSAKSIALNANDATALSTACDGYPQGSGTVPVEGASLDISKNNFLDNRSGPIETVSSFLNALNLKQYVRAYYYYQNPSSYPGPYAAYAAGYADTDVIKATFGNVQSEGAAGSLYYKVPLALKVTTTTNTKQTFVGCYTLRLGQPSFQGTPPFQPMGIIAGKFTQVSNGTDVNPLLPTACN